jgi:hypothetical protein
VTLRASGGSQAQVIVTTPKNVGAVLVQAPAATSTAWRRLMPRAAASPTGALAAAASPLLMAAFYDASAWPRSA